MKPISIFTWPALVIALASLAACGGGGGGGGVAGTDPTVANGFGAKGIIKKGKVLVCRMKVIYRTRQPLSDQGNITELSILGFVPF